MMAKRQKQASLLSIWTKKARYDERDDSCPPDEYENSVAQPEEGASSSHSNDQPQCPPDENENSVEQPDEGASSSR